MDREDPRPGQDDETRFSMRDFGPEAKKDDVDEKKEKRDKDEKEKNRAQNAFSRAWKWIAQLGKEEEPEEPEEKESPRRFEAFLAAIGGDEEEDRDEPTPAGSELSPVEMPISKAENQPGVESVAPAELPLTNPIEAETIISHEPEPIPALEETAPVETAESATLAEEAEPLRPFVEREIVEPETSVGHSVSEVATPTVPTAEELAAAAARSSDSDSEVYPSTTVDHGGVAGPVSRERLERELDDQTRELKRELRHEKRQLKHEVRKNRRIFQSDRDPRIVTAPAAPEVVGVDRRPVQQVIERTQSARNEQIITSSDRPTMVARQEAEAAQQTERPASQSFESKAARQVELPKDQPSPEVITKQVIEAAEHNEPIERRIEQSHEVKDTDSLRAAVPISQVMDEARQRYGQSMGSLGQSPASRSTPPPVMPPAKPVTEDMYAAAMRWGFWVAATLIVLAVIAYLALH